MKHALIQIARDRETACYQVGCNPFSRVHARSRQVCDGDDEATAAAGAAAAGDLKPTQFFYPIPLASSFEQTAVFAGENDPRNKRHITKQQYLVGAIFQMNARNTTEYNAFKSYPTSASLLWQNFQIKEKIVHVKDTHDSFQMASAICELVAEGVVAIFAPVHPETLTIIKSMTTQHRVLFFTTADAHHFGTGTSDLSNAANIVKLQPLKAPAMLDFMMHAEWEDVLYLYESEEAAYRLRWILEKAIKRSPTFTIDFRQLRWDPAPSVNGEEGGGGGVDSTGLRQHVNSHTHTFYRKSILVDLSKQGSTEKLVAAIGSIMPQRADLHFLIVGGDIKYINDSSLQFGGINMTALADFDFDSMALKNYKAELNPRARMSDMTNGNLSTEAALLIDGMKGLVQALRLLNEDVYAGRLSELNLYSNGETSPTGNMPCRPTSPPPFTAQQIIEKLQQIVFAGLTGNMSIGRNGFRDAYAFHLWGAKMKRSFSKLGEWNSLDGIVMRVPTDKNDSEASVDLKKVRIVSSILLSPFMMEKKDVNGNPIKGEYEGFCVDLVQKLAEMIKFKYKMKAVTDGQFGSLVNGSWDGMIGELLRREADIVVAPLTITSDRERVVDFTTPFMEFGLSVMYQKIDHPHPDPLSFMEPLSTEIWMCISFAYLGVSVVLFLVSRLSPTEWGAPLNKSKTLTDPNLDGDEGDGGVTTSHTDSIFSIFNSFWFALSTFVQQGGDIVPRSLSGRIVGGAWWFFTLIIVSSYTANLAAYLTVERMTNPIQSYEDLARQSKVKYGIIKSGSTRDFFEKSSIKIFQQMWKFMESNPEALAPTVKAGVERVINSNKDYAFILESTMNEYFNQRRPCTTVKVGPNLDSGKGYGVATPPGSDLRDRLNLAVLELKEMDWIAQLYRLWWEERGECGKMAKSADKNSATSSLGLDSVYGLFYLLAGALVIGIALAILEFIYRCAVNAKRTRTRFRLLFHSLISIGLLCIIMSVPPSSFRSVDIFRQLGEDAAILKVCLTKGNRVDSLKCQRIGRRRRFAEVFCEMLCQAIGKSGPRLDIPLMLYQSSAEKKVRHPAFDRDGEDEEIEEERGNDEGKMPTPPSPPPPPPKRSQIETSYLNTAKWRTRRDAVPEKIDYCL
ncbi:Glutamate receptor [Taenia crassiceps]|uniref:Glutamate receptor n=1 Tax=Taenia crassiceps TaxID=6207 RepID=A0ABR4PZR4_9CEST